LGTESRGRLIVLDPLDNLREVGVHNEGALAIVGSREVVANGIELGLNLRISGIVLNVGLSDLNDELTNGAD